MWERILKKFFSLKGGTYLSKLSMFNDQLVGEKVARSRCFPQVTWETRRWARKGRERERERRLKFKGSVRSRRGVPMLTGTFVLQPFVKVTRQSHPRNYHPSQTTNRTRPLLARVSSIKAYTEIGCSLCSTEEAFPRTGIFCFAHCRIRKIATYRKISRLICQFNSLPAREITRICFQSLSETKDR